MRSYDDAAAIAVAPTTATSPELTTLLSDRVKDWTALGLLDRTSLVIVEPGDTEEALVEAIGFSPLVNPMDGLRFGNTGFVSPWDWAEEHPGFLELMMTIGNGGHALFLLVSSEADIASELRTLCR